MNTEKLLETSGETYEYARMYVEQQVDMVRLETAKRIAKATSNLVTVGLVSLFAFLVLMFLSIALGFFLGTLLESYGLAFFIVAGLYLLITGIVIYFKKTLITNPVLSLIIKDILS